MSFNSRVKTTMLSSKAQYNYGVTPARDDGFQIKLSQLGTFNKNFTGKRKRKGRGSNTELVKGAAVYS